MDPAPYLARNPQIDPTAFVAASAVVQGDVTVGAEASIWPLAVLRGDIQAIVVGEASNIQDGTVIHVASDYGAEVGPRVTVGHRAIIHACRVEEEVLVGMGAIIMDGTEVGAGSVIGAGALVTRHQKIPAGSLVLGNPGRVVRALSAEERRANVRLAEKYVRVAARHRERWGT